MKILITGAAGFIGFHTIKRFLNDNIEIVGIDNINDYYSPQLKYDRLNELGIEYDKIKWFHATQSTKFKQLRFVRLNLEDKQQLFELFNAEKFDYVINLAAQAGVRYSIENPDVYISTNIIGFHYLLEVCRAFSVEHLVHASSSSVYGANAKIPFSEKDTVDTPVSLYAATKKSNELMAHTYSHLYNIPITCLRFFTVYGPWGRPDMAPMLFAKAISSGKSIKVFNQGNMERDFTYVGDIVEGIYLACKKTPDTLPPYKVLNIGNGSPVGLLDFIKEMESNFGVEAKKQFLPMQDGDVPKTWADVTDLKENYGYSPKTNIKLGLREFSTWYKSYYKL